MWPHLYLFCYLQLKTSFCTQISFNSIFTIKTAVCKCFASVVIQAWSCVFLVSICVELRIRRISEITVECEVATPCTGQPVILTPNSVGGLTAIVALLQSESNHTIFQIFFLLKVCSCITWMHIKETHKQIRR